MIRRAVYEITLRGTPPAGLTARFPSMTLQFLALALSACSGGESAARATLIMETLSSGSPHLPEACPSLPSPFG
jgi:hypothetical protein